ncbi:unnamed protein product [Amaranthus hypochondriacus]
MDNLPIEILASILAFIPVKSLIRFKCVSKTWHSIISSPYFSNLHLTHSISPDRLLILNRGCFLKPGYIDPNHGNNPSSFVPLFLDNSDNFGDDAGTTFSLPPQSNRVNVQLCGSCNGLIATVQKTVSDSICFLTGSFLYEVVLWNPMIVNSYYKLPSADLPVGIVSSVSFGFGFDSITSDYKVVRIVDFKVRHLSCCFSLPKRQVMVYSLKQVSWGVPKEQFCDDRLALLHKRGELVNNILHWIFYDHKNGVHRLRGFNLCSEQWTDLLPLPDYKENTRKCEDVKDLGVLGGCLCFVVRPYEFNTVNVWIMKEYGVKKSWSKLFSLSEMDVIGPLCSSPIAYSTGGEEVMVRNERDSSGLIWFNFKDKTFKSIDHIGASLDVIICNGSLVPLPKIDGLT